jgi:malate/lactate dehydrogenase
MTLVESERRSVIERESEMTALAMAVAVKEFAKTIRDSSTKMCETLRTLHQTGAIDEMADAIRAAAVATRDTAREIEEISKEIKDRGVIKETKNAVKDAVTAVRETEQTLEESLGKQRKSKLEAEP